tara:strand:+ start:601 stop:1227 length:627 start_codon:yes stop_codon:yes gene_type:complete
MGYSMEDVLSWGDYWQLHRCARRGHLSVLRYILQDALMKRQEEWKRSNRREKMAREKKRMCKIRNRGEKDIMMTTLADGERKQDDQGREEGKKGLEEEREKQEGQREQEEGRRRRDRGDTVLDTETEMEDEEECFIEMATWEGENRRLSLVEVCCKYVSCIIDLISLFRIFSLVFYSLFFSVFLLFSSLFLFLFSLLFYDTFITAAIL